MKKPRAALRVLNQEFEDDLKLGSLLRQYRQHGNELPEPRKRDKRYLICPIKIMTALPKVSATETADLRDVHKRLASREHIGYFCNGAWGMWLWTVTKIYPEGF
jgi:hypothetical protein